MSSYQKPDLSQDGIPALPAKDNDRLLCPLSGVGKLFSVKGQRDGKHFVGPAISVAPAQLIPASPPPHGHVLLVFGRLLLPGLDLFGVPQTH